MRALLRVLRSRAGPIIQPTSRPLSTSPCLQDRLPSFTSDGNFDQFRARPNFLTRMCVLFSGHGFVPLRQTNTKEFAEGAQLALSVVTSELADGNLEALREHLTPECYEKISKFELEPEERDTLVIDTEDILLPWLSFGRVRPDQVLELTLGTISLKGAEAVRKLSVENNEKYAAFIETLKKEKDKKEWADELKAFFAKLPDPNALMAGNSLVITNTRFVQKPDTSEWLVDGIQVRNGLDCMPKLFYIRWWGRVTISLRTKVTFLGILRYDWATDILLFVAILLVLFGSQPPPPKKEGEGERQPNMNPSSDRYSSS